MLRARTKMLWVVCLFFLALGFLCAGTSAVYAAGGDENFVGGIGFIDPEFEGDDVEQPGKIKMKARIAEKLSKRSTKTLPQRAMKDAATEASQARATLFSVEPEINEIKVTPATLGYGGGPVEVTVEGSNLTNDDRYVADFFVNGWYMGYVTLDHTDEGSLTATFNIPANDTEMELEYTLKARPLEVDYFESPTATVTVAANPNPVEIAEVTVEPSGELGYAGGEVIVTVTGKNMTSEYEVHLVNSGGMFVGLRDLEVEETATQGTAKIFIPENTLGTPVQYTLRVYSFSTWEHIGPKATVAVTANPNGAVIEEITFSPQPLSHEGGDITVTVTGSNMEIGDYIVYLFDNEGGEVDYNDAISGSENEWMTSIFVPSNPFAEAQEYTLKVWNNDVGLYFDAEATVTVAANPNPATVDSITVDKSALDHNGGDVEVTVTGSNMTGDYTVDPFYNGVETGTYFDLTDDEGSRTATVTIPANDTDTAQKYTLKVWGSGIGYFDSPTAIVTVAANPDGAAVNEITASSQQVAYTGEEITVTVTGSKMQAEGDLSYSVWLFQDGMPLGDGAAELSGSETEQTATLAIPGNSLGETQEYTLRVRSAAGMFFDATTTVTVAANPSGPTVSSVTATPDELSYEGGDVEVTVAGSNMAGDYTVDLFYDGVYQGKEFNLVGDANSRTATVTLPVNDTDVARQYTLKVYSYELNTYFTATTTVTVTATSDTPVAVDSIAASSSELPADGGDITATVTGNNLPTGYSVDLFHGTDLVETFTLAGDATTQQGTVSIPANETGEAQIYTLRAKNPATAEYFDAVATVTVAAKPNAPTVDSVLASKDSLSHEGGNVEVTVAGSNMAGDYTVDLFYGDEKQGAFSLTGGAESRTATVTLPPNTTTTAQVYTLKVHSEALNTYFAKTATVTVGARDPNPTPVPVDEPAKPDENDAVDQTITLKDTNGNVLKVEEIPETPDNQAANAKLAEMGLSAAVDENGQIHLTGTANDIGEVTLTVTVIGEDGKSVETTVTIKVNPVYHTEGPAVDDAPADWTGTLQNAEGGAGYLFTLYIPLDLTTTEDGKLKEVSADVTGASNLGIEIADDVDESRENSDAARSENIVRRYARLTGTTTDPDEVLIKSVTYRVGIHMHTQTVDVRLTDTAIEDETPGGHYGSNGCNTGAAYGISLALLAMLRLRPMRRK